MRRDREGVRLCGARTLACRVDTRVDIILGCVLPKEPRPFGSGQEPTSAFSGQGSVNNPYHPHEART
jgi:hypothetical protein